MKTVKELRADQARLVTEARAKLEEAQTATEESRSKELEGQYDKIMADHDKIEAQIERQQKLEDAEARRQQGSGRQPNGENRQVGGTATDDADPITYRQAFAQAICGPLEHMSAEARAVLLGGAAKFESRAQTVGTNSAGGYTVPTELMAMIDKAMAAWGPMYDTDICTVITTSGGGQLTLPTVDDTAVTAGAHTEGVALTDDGGKDVTLGQKVLNAYAYDTEFVRWSWELDDDSIFSMETLLADLLGERLARIANSQLTTGTGSSAPNGIVTASAAGKTAAATTAITADEIIDLVHSVDPAYRTSPKTRFMFNDSTLAAVRKLKDGNGNYLWQMGNVQTGVPGNILGYSYSINQSMDSLAAAKKVMLFGDFGRYYVRKVGAPVLGVMRERFWPDLGIAGLIRFDGELANSAAVKHLITAAV